MVWNKTPQDKVDEIVNVIKTTDKLDYEIAKEFGVSAWLVSEISRKNLTVEERKVLWHARAQRSKIGDKNPMYNKRGAKHHNAVEISRCMGYRTVFKPEWWESNTKDYSNWAMYQKLCRQKSIRVIGPKNALMQLRS